MAHLNMKEKLLDLVVSNVVSNAVYVGVRLNLLKVLAEISSKEKPVAPEELAKAAGCKERYVREWCNCLACGGILEVNEQEQFWIAAENVEALTTDCFQLTANGMMVPLLEPFEKLLECFKQSGPYGLDYSQFKSFQEYNSAWSKSLHEKHVIPDMLPAIGNGMREKLEKGAMRVLDVGCGNGFHSSLLAEHFPNSHFVGLDIGADAIKQANSRKTKSGAPFKNLEFVQCDAGKMRDSWSESFDLVLIFDACHDQCRPDLCIQQIHRVLKPNGVFAMVEVVGSSNVFTDRQKLGPMAALMYGCSMFHCLPVGSNRPDALCYGAMWGQKRALDLLKRSGFPDVKVVETPYFTHNLMYLAKKT